ncbi:MAG: hypothetical protein JEZ03_16385 [Bacteroidales bacterium]|nr:hypothetical protein [Bacteroidales bacterium]
MEKNMKKLTLLIIAFITCIMYDISIAQTFNWGFAEGSSSSEKPYDLQIDSYNNIYVTGVFSDVLTFGDNSTGVTLTPSEDDMFLAKYSPEGELLWAVSEQGGSQAYEYGSHILLKEDRILVCGGFDGTMTFGTGGTSQTINCMDPDTYDIYIAQYSLDGEFIEVLHQGGSGSDNISDIKLDTDGNIIVYGNYKNELTLGTGNNTVTLNATSDSDIYLGKYNPDMELIWAKSFGGEYYDLSGEIAIDNQNNIICTGSFDEQIIFEDNTILDAYGYDDILLTKFDSDGNLIWATTAGGGDIDRGESVAIDSDNNIYYTGTFNDNITIGEGSNQTTIYGVGNDIFLAKVDPQGVLVWCNTDGGDEDDAAYSLVIKNNFILTCGDFMASATFGSGENQTILESEDESTDCFISKYDLNGELIYVFSLTGPGTDNANVIRVSENSEILIAGNFRESITLGDDNNSINLTVEQGTTRDIFITKFTESETINTQPVDVTLCEGNSTSFSVSINGTNTYQWQVNEGFGYTNVVDDNIYSNSTTQSLLLSDIPSNMNSFAYKCVITGENNSYILESDQAVLSVNEQIISDAGEDMILYLPTNYTQLNASNPGEGIGTWSVIEGSAEFSDSHQADCIVTGLSNTNNVLQWTVINGTCESEDQVTISIVDDIKLLDELNIKVYPNPAQDILCFESDRVLRVEIYNLLGTKKNTYNIQKGLSKIDISHLNDSFLILKIWLDNRSVSYKLAVNK